VSATRKTIRPLWSVILADLLLTLLILGGWLMTRWISIHRMADAYQQEPLPETTVTAVSSPAPGELPAVAPPTSAPSPAEPANPPESVPETTPETTAEPLPGTEETRTPWQIRFAEQFTPEVETGEGYYTSPNVSVHVSRHTYEGREGTTVFYVADIYVARIECLRSYFAGGNEFPYTTDGMIKMSRGSGAVIAVNGDYCGLSYGGTVLRNGKFLYSDNIGNDVCLLYRDGRMECPALRRFDLADYQGENELWQVWTFGPALLDGNGRALSIEEMNRSSTSRPENPRTALGYYEPGHYCFIVADGRDGDYSAGLWLEEFAEVCALAGCAQAYNMDGGGSSMMVMNDAFVNQPSSGGRRGIPDIILIADLADPADKETEK